MKVQRNSLGRLLGSQEAPLGCGSFQPVVTCGLDVLHCAGQPGTETCSKKREACSELVMNLQRLSTLTLLVGMIFYNPLVISPGAQNISVLEECWVLNFPICLQCLLAFLCKALVKQKKGVFMAGRGSPVPE